MVKGQGGWRLEDDRDTSSAPPLGLAKVKAIAQQDESIGRMGVGAISLIARCTDAFLADLVTASADRARAEGLREPKKNIRKRPATSTPPAQQVLPADVRKAVTEEERFDFLRPILVPPQDGCKDSLGAAAAGAKGKRKRGPTSGKAGTGGAGVGKGKNDKRMVAELAGAAESGAASASDIQPSASGMTKVAGAGSGGLLALAGLDEKGRRRALLGGLDSKPPPVASVLGDDEDEDYDNY
eukprot:g2654.t1